MTTAADAPIKQPMGTMRRLMLSLLITLVVWSIFSWPLPRFLFSDIPFSSHENGERQKP